MGQPDLLLINPGGSESYQGLASSFRGIEPPFWCGLLASFIQGHGYEVKILDADAENWSPEQIAEKITEQDPLLVAIIVQGDNPSASSTPKMTPAKKLVAEIKEMEPDIPIMIGGLHPSALPERTLQETAADFVCQGEGFYTIWGILKKTPYSKIPGLSYRDGDSIVSTPRAPVLPPGELPPVAWDLLDMSKYHAHNWHALDNIDRRSPYGVIYTSLGCPYDCHYCQIKQLYSGKPGIRFRPPEKIIDEIDLLVNRYGVRHIKFMDELFTVNEKQVAGICDPIIRRGYDLNIWVYGRVDRVTQPMLDKIKQAGINWVCYGFESASEEVRQGVHKEYGQDKMEQAIEMTRNAGIHIIANFIFGLPDDDLESMRNTLDTAKRYNFEYVNFYPCFAYPGSQLYDNSIQEGVKLPEAWEDYAPLSYGALPLPTKYLSSQEVLAFRDKAFQEYFNRPEYLEMIGAEFGDKAAKHIKGRSSIKLGRRLLGDW